MFAAILIAASGCRTKRILEKSPLVPLGENALMELVQAHTFDFYTLNGKMAVRAQSPGQNGSFKINLRMASDSVIWMSITPALGIEAARVLLRPDSLKFIDKLNNTYYRGGFDLLDSMINYYAEYSLVQNILTGNPIQIDPDEKYVASVEGLNYMLTTKTGRKLRKSIEVTEDLYGVPALGVVKQRKYRKAKEKYDDSDLIIKRYTVRPGDFKVVRSQVDDIAFGRSLQVDYDDFRETEGRLLPMKITIRASAPDQSAKFELSYSRIRLDEQQSYPFKIPAKYTPFR